MRGRSHHNRVSNTTDDWGDGSWTVDCVCGVNFDDGEEMVNCDECGVWVHTRCSRFVKTHTSFACDKCNKRISYYNTSNNEETEVAQLLVDLPTKTMRMPNPNTSNNNSYPFPSARTPLPPPLPLRSTFRLWTDVPIEERVHVHGLPGGDPALFQGSLRNFGSALGMCPRSSLFNTGNFLYGRMKNQLKNWKKKKMSTLSTEGQMLFSLSKQIVSANPVEMLVSLRGSVDGGSRDMKLSHKQSNKRENSNNTHSEDKRGKIRIRPFGIHLGKQKKDDKGTSKDPNLKKKARSVDKDMNNKAFTPAIDAQKLEFREDGGFMVDDKKFQETQNADQLRLHAGSCIEVNDGSKHKDDVVANMHSVGDSSQEASRHISTIEPMVKLEKVQDSKKCEGSPETAAMAMPHLEKNGGYSVTKQEVLSTVVDGLNGTNERHESEDVKGSSSNAAVHSQKPRPPFGDLGSAASDARNGRSLEDPNDIMSVSSYKPNIEVKTGENINKGHSDFPPCDGKLDSRKHLDQHQETSVSTHPSENLEVHQTVRGNFSTGEAKATLAKATLSNCDKDCDIEGMMPMPGELCQKGQERKGSAELKHGTKDVKESAKVEGMKPSSPASLSQRKVVSGMERSSSNSITGAISKSAMSGSSKPPGRPSSPNTLRLMHSNQRVKVNSHMDSKKDYTVIDAVREDVILEISRKIVREQAKASANSGLRTSHLSRQSHNSISKSDSKEQTLHSSSKASTMQNLATSLGSVESASVLQTESLWDVQNKTTATGFSQKGERLNHSQQSSKAIHSSAMHPPALVSSSTALSDEELALLLHQELNSSSRVPRVPRMRHSNSMPQVASPTATSMLIKRSSSSGGKDNLVLRRTGKEDAPKDGFRNFGELIDETRKMDRLLCSPQYRKRDSVVASDGSTKREACTRSPKVGNSTKTNASLTSTNNVVPSSSEATDENQSSIQRSPRNMGDDGDEDDAGRISGPAPRTLPGLISEIMSSGRRMTYEELCDVVLPHWHKLRKHNRERYAYSTHSQAVLDCLRNRNEWAQLVDRGPKTNGGRKKRKFDLEIPVVEPEENKYTKGNVSKELEGKNIESHRENFPKGKRKARKCRRLALHGRGIKDVRKRRKVDGSMDVDASLFSHSSKEGGESVFIDNDGRGARTSVVKALRRMSLKTPQRRGGRRGGRLTSLRRSLTFFKDILL